MAIFALGAAPFIGECLALLWRQAPGFARALVDRATMLLAVLVPPALVAAAWFVARNGFYRWNSETHEFGTGVLQNVLFPVRASAFAKETKLPPPLFNDLTTGGYLAWDPQVAEMAARLGA